MKTDPDRQQSVLDLDLDEQARESWASKIKPARVAKGLTQQELADMSGVARRTIGNIEGGKMVPQIAVLRRLLIALDLGPDPAGSYPDWVEEWLAVIAPLIQSIPQPPRNRVMTDVVLMLGNAVAEGAAMQSPARPTSGGGK
ncbi:helix-turn-helix domain-containing protein [Rhodococcus qingshengii]